MSLRIAQGGAALVTRERLHELVEELPEQQTEEAARLLELLKRQASVKSGDAADQADMHRTTAAEILAQYGPPKAVVPAAPLSNIERFVGRIFPEDESAEEFDATIRRWRTEGERSRLPD
jgi:hypothetical protein